MTTKELLDKYISLIDNDIGEYMTDSERYFKYLMECIAMGDEETAELEYRRLKKEIFDEQD
jgi:hypothetical protein